MRPHQEFSHMHIISTTVFISSSTALQNSGTKLCWEPATLRKFFSFFWKIGIWLEFWKIGRLLCLHVFCFVLCPCLRMQSDCSLCLCKVKFPLILNGRRARCHCFHSLIHSKVLCYYFEEVKKNGILSGEDHQGNEAIIGTINNSALWEIWSKE